MAVTQYTKNLIAKGEERRRLTSQLAKLVSDVAEEIANTVPLKTTVEVAGKIYRTHRYTTNVGSWRTVVVVAGDSIYALTDDAPPGDYFYLFHDFSCQVNVAERDDFLHFANHLPEIVIAFEAEEDRVIKALREAFEKLRKIAEVE